MKKFSILMFVFLFTLILSVHATQNIKTFAWRHRRVKNYHDSVELITRSWFRKEWGPGNGKSFLSWN